MMHELVLHPRTQKSIDGIIRKPPHALVVAGPTGSGKWTLAQRIAEQLLGKPIAQHPYVHILQSEPSKALTIEQVRDIEKFLERKVPSANAVNRIIMIENAQKLGEEAQNALLKTLEEPPAGTVLLLTADYAASLLPTIQSRTQIITVQPPSRQALASYFGDSTDFDKAYSMSGGLPGLMHALLHDTDHPLLAATEQARHLLGASTFERLTAVDVLSKQRALALDTVFILQQMARLRLQSAQGAAAEQWQAVLQAAYTAEDQLLHNVQPKLALTQLMLHL